MITDEDNIIGRGGHSTVKRLTVNLMGKDISVVRKHGKPGKVDDNIVAFNRVLRTGLPTLNRYVKINELEIEAEDLNADTSKGFFVSPNTVRACQTYGDLFLRFIKQETLSEFEISCCKEADFYGILQKYSEGGIEALELEGIFDKLRERRIVFGAEGEVYNNPIAYIGNLDSFWLSSKEDLKTASLSSLNVYTDAFFFRVNPLNGEMEYTIADFDCILDVSRFPGSYEGLMAANIESFKTALSEYIQFFVIEEKQNGYLKQIEDFK